MVESTHVLLQYPTVIFSLIAFVTTGYWLIGLMGIVGIDVDIDIDADGSSLSSVFGMVPFTVIGYFGMFLSATIMSFTGIESNFIVNLVVFIVALILAALMASLITKPLYRHMKIQDAPSVLENESDFAIVRHYNKSNGTGDALLEKNPDMIVDFTSIDDLEIDDRILLGEFTAKTHSYEAYKSI